MTERKFLGGGVMEYIFLTDKLIEIAPGFIGIAVSKLFVGKTESENIESYVLGYFLYTASSWLVNSFVCYIFGITNETVVITLSIAIVVVIAVLWNLVLQDMMLRIVNRLNGLFGKNSVFTEETVFEKVFKDGKDHYIIARIGDKILGYGFLENFDYKNESFSLIPPEKDEYIKNKGVKRIIVYTNKDLCLEELDVEVENIGDKSI